MVIAIVIDKVVELYREACGHGVSDSLSNVVVAATIPPSQWN